MNQIYTDRQSACTILKDADIWLDNDNIDGFKVTIFLGNLLKLGNFEQFHNVMDKLERADFENKIHQRLIFAKGHSAGIQSILIKANSDSNLKRVLLKPFDGKKTEIKCLKDIFFKRPGLYFRNNHNQNEKREDFIKDFAHCDDRIKKIYRERGFERSLGRYSQEKFRVIECARIHAFNSKFYAISDKDGFYDSTNAACLARLSNINMIDVGQPKYIERAIILPIEYACRNYYHNLAECMSGLVYLAELPPEIPVIYTEDHFAVLDFMVSRLCMDRSRFIPMSACKNLIIEKAVQLYPGSFTWDEDIYKFHKKISYPQTLNSKIYISRRKSSRSPTNEIELEDTLRKLDFDIIFPEELDFSQQVFLFSNASIVISPHGAGLSNMLFMPKGSILIEIFNKGFIQPDYYLRSRHNEIKYASYIQDDETIDISVIETLITKLL